MIATDPRILLRILHDLSHEMLRWTYHASNTISESTRRQRYIAEQIDQASHNARIVKDQAERDSLAIEDAIANAEKLRADCLEANEASKECENLASAALNRADGAHKLWKNELQKAIEWLTRSEARLERARAWLQRAIRDLEEARSNLEYAERAVKSSERAVKNAERALQRCQRDKDRRDCSREMQRLSDEEYKLSDARFELTSSHRAVLAAEEDLALAEAEVRAAEAEVERAKRRVEACQKAVNFAQQALATAEKGKRLANLALDSAERSHEYSMAIDRAVADGQKHLVKEEQEAESCLFHVDGAIKQKDEGNVHLKNAEQMETFSQRLAFGVRYELEHRMRRLRELDMESDLIR